MLLQQNLHKLNPFSWIKANKLHIAAHLCDSNIYGIWHFIYILGNLAPAVYLNNMKFLLMRQNLLDVLQDL